jgi:hypothetical protein
MRDERFRVIRRHGEPTSRIGRLINLWIHNRVERGDDYDVPLKAVLAPENIEWVSRLDLLRDYDAAAKWDQYRTRELVRYWLRSRPAEGRRQ